MSLKNIIKFNEYTPPAPKDISVSYSDKSKTFEMNNGDVIKYLQRANIRTISANFALTSEQRIQFKSSVLTGNEITVQYSGETIFMNIKSFSEKTISITKKGNYEISISLEECRR